MKKFKKIVAIALAATMLMGMSQMSLSAFAATVQSESVSAYSGSCGDNVQYELDISTGTLTISGTGAMKDYGYYDIPWYNNRNSVKSLVINDGVTHISGFYNCTNLASVSIPDSVTTIGASAFYNCSSLTAISIPDSVAVIGESAFSNCSSLTVISIPKFITTIAAYSFSGCSNLASVSIPDSVTVIGESAFRNCSSLTNITIPDSVTDLGAYAFIECTGLETVKLPANIKEIKNETFSGCNSLKSVTIPVGVERIGSYAFNGCSSINELILSDTVKEIDDYAFYGIALRRVFIPDTVTSLQYHSFAPNYAYIVLVSSIGSPAYWLGQDEEASFTFESTGEYYNASGACGDNAAFTFSAESGLLTISGTGNMEDYYTSNWDSESNTPWFCFRKGIKNVVIEDGITSVGYVSFSHCEYLESVYVPNSVTRIEGSLNKYNLTNVKLISCEGGSAESYANENGFKFESTGDYFTSSGKCGDNITYAYDGKTKALVLSGTGAIYDLEWVEGNPGHYSFPWYSYRNCIESIEINEGITTVDINSIDGDRIKTIDIPASLSKLVAYGNEVNCFNDYYLNSLERINVASGNSLFADIDGVLFNAEKTTLMQYPRMHGENYVIPDGVVSVDGAVFLGNDNIKSIVMPDIVASDMRFGFDGCTSLESVVLPNSLTSIGDCQFRGCESLKQINIPNGVTSIGESAFDSCKKLQSVVIPAGVTSIAKYAFYRCEELKSVVIPEGVTYLSYNTFSECNSLRTLVIPESVTAIDDYAISMKDRSILVIYGVPGSYAQTYAESHNFTFRDINEQIEPSVVGYSVSLGGDIGLNYFVDLGYDSLNKDIKMTFVNEATGKEIITLGLYDSSNAVVDGKPYYKFTCPVSASHMSDRVKAVITIDGVSQELNVYSVKEYAETILGDEKYASAAPVVKAMLNYGAYSEIALLGVKTSDTNSALTAEEKQLGEVDLSADDYSFMSNYDDAYSDYVQYAGSRISLKNETVIKHYFKIDESKVDPSTLHVYCDSKETTFVKDGEYYRVDIKGINAKQLYYDFYVNIDSKKDGVTISSWSLRNYSVCTYINSALNSTTISDEVKDTVKALYFFYLETSNYSAN